MSHTICTFNVNNLYLRYKFGQIFPGDRSAKSEVENAAFGYLPMYDPALFELFNSAQRDLAASAITCDGTIFPDVLCLQEVESLLALREFNEEHLCRKFKQKYKYALLVDSRDFRQIDVAVLSNLEILDVRSHVDDLDPEPDSPQSPFLFSRDCLEVELALNSSGTQRLTLFVNHLKSKLASTATERKQADKKRKRQAKRVQEIIHSRFPGAMFHQELFAAVGDFNDDAKSPSLKPLVQQAGLNDALARLPQPEERWTHWYRSENTVSQFDYLLLSPALDSATAGVCPKIERRGLGFSRILADGKTGPKFTYFHEEEADPNPIRVGFQFTRFCDVTRDDYASDHCPIFLEIP